MTEQVQTTDTMVLKADTIVPGKSRMIVPKGTDYHSMKDGEHHKTKRELIVTTHGTSGIYIDEITWAGSGGYWHRAKKVDVKFALFTEEREQEMKLAKEKEGL